MTTIIDYLDWVFRHTVIRDLYTLKRSERHSMGTMVVS